MTKKSMTAVQQSGASQSEVRILPPKKRKTRSDKGLILLTERDIYCLGWIADQYAARLDQIQQILSQWPCGELKDKSKGLAQTTVKDQVSRWKRAGWVEYHRVLVGQPGWAWITKKGLQTLGWDEFYQTARTPASTRLNHIYAVNQLRLFLDTQEDVKWKSEREYRTELESVKKGESLGPIPDAIVSGKGVDMAAIEVELTAKKPDDLRRKLKSLVNFRDSNFELAFPKIWFYVPDEHLKRLVENACGYLSEEDQQRISVYMWVGLLPEIKSSTLHH